MSWLYLAPLAALTAGLLAILGGDAAIGTIVTRDAALARILPEGARIEKLAGGFRFTEGPVWRSDRSRSPRTAAGATPTGRPST